MEATAFPGLTDPALSMSAHQFASSLPPKGPAVPSSTFTPPLLADNRASHSAGTPGSSQGVLGTATALLCLAVRCGHQLIRVFASLKLCVALSLQRGCLSGARKPSVPLKTGSVQCDLGQGREQWASGDRDRVRVMISQGWLGLVLGLGLGLGLGSVGVRVSRSPFLALGTGSLLPAATEGTAYGARGVTHWDGHSAACWGLRVSTTDQPQPCPFASLLLPSTGPGGGPASGGAPSNAAGDSLVGAVGDARPRPGGGGGGGGAYGWRRRCPSVAAAPEGRPEGRRLPDPPLAPAVPWFPAEITWLSRFHGERPGWALPSASEPSLPAPRPWERNKGDAPSQARSRRTPLPGHVSAAGRGRCHRGGSGGGLCAGVALRGAAGGGAGSPHPLTRTGERSDGGRGTPRPPRGRGERGESGARAEGLRCRTAPWGREVTATAGGCRPVLLPAAEGGMRGGINETDLALLPAPSSYLPALPRNPLGSREPLTPSPPRRGAPLRPGPGRDPCMAPRAERADSPLVVAAVTRAGLCRSCGRRGRGGGGGRGSGLLAGGAPQRPSRRAEAATPPSGCGFGSVFGAASPLRGCGASALQGCRAAPTARPQAPLLGLFIGPPLISVLFLPRVGTAQGSDERAAAQPDGDDSGTRAVTSRPIPAAPRAVGPPCLGLPGGTA